MTSGIDWPRKRIDCPATMRPRLFRRTKHISACPCFPGVFHWMSLGVVAACTFTFFSYRPRCPGIISMCRCGYTKYPFLSSPFLFCGFIPWSFFTLLFSGLMTYTFLNLLLFVLFVVRETVARSRCPPVVSPRPESAKRYHFLLRFFFPISFLFGGSFLVSFYVFFSFFLLFFLCPKWYLGSQPYLIQTRLSVLVFSTCRVAIDGMCGCGM